MHQHALTWRKCTFVIGRFVAVRKDSQVWLSQIRIWQGPDIRLDWTELSRKNGKKCSVPPSLANLFHIWHDIKLSLHVQFTLLGVCKRDVDLLAFFDGVLERLWLTIATYGKHPEHASCRFYISKCMNVGWLYRVNKHMHGKSTTDYYANYAATI